jgi:hypothetical protein
VNDGRCRRELVSPADVHVCDHVAAEVVLQDVPARKRDGKVGVADYGRGAERAVRSDLDVVDDVRDDLWKLERVEVSFQLSLQRLEELLLPGDAVEVGVCVSEADELQRASAAEELVSGLEVDVRVVRGGSTVVSVVVAAVDVEPDPSEVVDDLLEAVEVDGDQ